MNWRMSPFLRRFLTRSVAIIPAIIIAGAEGQQGLAAALNGCNVVLSVALIFLTFPLIWYTSFDKYMRVKVDDSEEPVGVVDGILTYDTERALAASGADARGTISLANNMPTKIGAFVIWFSEFAHVSFLRWILWLDCANNSQRNSSSIYLTEQSSILCLELLFATCFLKEIC
jgi:Mn2+/Fe2+ NRAMP family transporter